MEKILITGSSNGIGKATAELFLNRGFEVVGLDLLPATIENSNYKHFICDCSKKEDLPEVNDINYLFINAGSQGTSDDIKNNLYSAIYTLEKYGNQPFMKSILFNASVSAHNGAEFIEYVASKGGMLPVMKQAAAKLAYKRVTVNSLSCGGVTTDLNKPVMDDHILWNQIMDLTPMNKWATAEEVAEWVYFLTVINKSCTGQDIVIDNGEYTIASSNNFIFPGYSQE